MWHINLLDRKTRALAKSGVIFCQWGEGGKRTRMYFLTNPENLAGGVGSEILYRGGWDLGSLKRNLET